MFQYPEHLSYFHSTAVRGFARCRFVGSGGACKRRLLRHARCVVVVSELDETNSLGAREALL